MDLMTGLVNDISAMKAEKTQYEASVKVMKNALDVQEQTGRSVLSLLEGGDVNKAQAGNPTGSNIDLLA
ncbi:MAG: YjfB family protein [Deferribacterales bacterium]|jgi:hypothetical protein